MDSSSHEHEILRQFVNHTFHNSHIDIVSISGFLSPKAVTILLPLVQHKQMFFNVVTDHIAPENLLSLPSATITTLLIFMKRMN